MTVIVVVPFGVPGFELLPPLLPLQEPSQSVENPRTMISPSIRMPRSDRLREPIVNMIPSRPGSNAAQKIRIPRSGRSAAVAAVVLIVIVTEV